MAKRTLQAFIAALVQRKLMLTNLCTTLLHATSVICWCTQYVSVETARALSASSQDCAVLHACQGFGIRKYSCSWFTQVQYAVQGEK